MEPSLRNTLEREIVGCQTRIRRFAYSLTKRSAQADDLVQDTMVKAITSLEQFRPGTNMYAWLCTIMKNHFYSQQRQAWRTVEDPEGYLVGNHAVEADQLRAIENREEEAQSVELLKAIRSMMKQLSEQQRNAFWLVHAEGNSYEEVAQIQDCPLGTVKSRVSRALHSLLAMVQEKGLDAEGITADNWIAAFSSLSFKVTGTRKRSKGKKTTEAAGVEFCGLKFNLVETVNLKGGLSTQVFALAS